MTWLADSPELVFAAGTIIVVMNSELLNSPLRWTADMHCVVLKS